MGHEPQLALVLRHRDDRAVIVLDAEVDADVDTSVANGAVPTTVAMNTNAVQPIL